MTDKEIFQALLNGDKLREQHQITDEITSSSKGVPLDFFLDDNGNLITSDGYAAYIDNYSITYSYSVINNDNPGGQ